MSIDTREKLITEDLNIEFEVSTHASLLRRFVLGSLPAVLAVIGSIGAAVFSMRLWRMHLGIPLEYNSDLPPHAMHIKQLIDNGWFFSDPRLGAPVGQHFQDWPLPDLLSLGMAKVLALFSNNWAVVVNAMYLLGFPLAALSAWWVLKKIGISAWVASALGILYSVLPFHFARGEHHLFLSNYFIVPFGAYLAWQIIDGSSPFSSTLRFRSRLLRFVSVTTVQTVVFCALIGTGGIYYAAFTLLFIAVAVIARVVANRSWKPLATGAIVAALIIGAVGVSLAPTVIYHREHGANELAGKRQPAEADIYGLKLAQMLAPVHGHRIPALDDLQARYINEFPLSGEAPSAALGVVTSFGLLSLICVALFGATRTRATNYIRRQRQLATLALSGILVASVGGISTFIGLLVMAQIRSWNRISIFIALFALASVGFTIDALSRRNKKWVLPVAVSALVVVGLFDQLGTKWVPDYKSVDTEFLSDQAYFRQIETQMPTGAMIYQLPRMDFPEPTPTVNLSSYEMLRPYLHTDDLRWSYGGIRGREESEWQDSLSTDTAQMIDQLKAKGFTGIYVDRNGYADNGVAIEQQLQQLLTVKPFTNKVNNKAFYEFD